VTGLDSAEAVATIRFAGVGALRTARPETVDVLAAVETV
jgi:hypothetical protein